MGKHVRQRVLAYLGPGEPSGGYLKQVKQVSNDPELIPEEKEQLIGDLTRAEGARNITLKAFEMTNVAVRHDIPEHYSRAGEVRFYCDGRVEASFKADVEVSVYIHELGHVVDAILADRIVKQNVMFSDYCLSEHPDYKDIKKDCEHVANHNYFDGFLRKFDLKQKAKRWGLSGWIAAYKLRKLEKFLVDYAGSPEEGFANCFSLMMLSPEHAENMAPTLTKLIKEEMSRHPDLKTLLNDFQALHKPPNNS